MLAATMVMIGYLGLVSQGHSRFACSFVCRHEARSLRLSNGLPVCASSLRSSRSLVAQKNVPRSQMGIQCSTIRSSAEVASRSDDIGACSHRPPKVSLRSEYPVGIGQGLPTGARRLQTVVCRREGPPGSCFPMLRKMSNRCWTDRVAGHRH